MYERTNAFDEATRNSHTVVTIADVLVGGSVLRSSIPVSSGSVDVDGTAAIRRRCSITVVDDDGTLAGGPTPVLSPYGREIRLYRGLVLPTGVTETLAIGTFRISTVSVNDSGADRRITITGFDRARSIARARFETPYTVAAGTNYAAAISDLLANRLPTISTRFATTGALTPLLVFEQGADPWKAANDMAASIGCELYFDTMGVCVMVASSDALNVVWDYGEGSGAVVLSVDDVLSDEPGYNGVVVDGEATNVAPVHAVVYDTDPTSPTYSLGPYGKVPRFYKSQFITTADQASAAAVGFLIKERGATEALRFSAIAHPAHEVGDLVRVADSALGIDGNYYLESFSLPLEPGAMTCSTRKRRAVT